MTGVTIDHMVALTVFLGALLLFVGLFNQSIQTAILYQRHRFIATKCSDLVDNILLNPGSPYDWGTNSSSKDFMTIFGLQDPEFQQYRLSPFSLMRLVSSSGDKIYYDKTGKWYSNISWGINGGYLLLQESDCVTYANVTKLLGTNGTYDFQLSTTPTLTVAITEVQQNPLKLEIQVYGPSFPLANATITYLMFWTNKTVDTYPMLYFSADPNLNTVQTDSSGIAYKEFEDLNVEDNNSAYAFIAKVQVGGLCGIGYISRETTTGAGNLIPFIDNYENGTILLAHKWGKHDPSGSEGALFFNASYYVLPDNFAPILAANLADKVNYGNSIPYQTMQVPSNLTGFLVAAYSTGNDYGIVLMPWGIGTIGNSVVFGNAPVEKEWVATDIRQVLVNDVAYQAQLSLWSLEGYSVVS